MCDPVSLGVSSLALSGAGTVGGFMQSSAQSKASSQTAFNNALSANQNYVSDMLQLADRMQQERIASATKIGQMNREATSAYADTTERASEMGVSGNTITALMGDLHGQEDTRENIVSDNSDATIKQLQFSADAEGDKLENRIQSAKASIAPAPSLASLALGFAKDGLDSYNAYSSATKANSVNSLATRLLNIGG